MGFMSKFFGNTRKPEGFFGKIMVATMNGGGHKKLAKWGLKHINFRGDEYVLDCGCGGGANIKRLLENVPGGKVYGVDYSNVSVEKSKKVNEKAISEKRCEIIEGNTADLVFEDEKFDVITAFETVYFWKPIEGCFKEIYRVLKKDGQFMIVNEDDGRGARGQKWAEIIDGMTIYTGEMLRDILKNAGFENIKIYDKVDNNRLTVIAKK